MGKFIAIEGLDGSGKSTQIDLLKKYLSSRGISVRYVHFPRLNDGLYGELIAKFLRGEFNCGGKVHPQLVALLFAEDRKDFAPTLRKWLEDPCNFILVDRYVLSNIAFQCAKLQDPQEQEELKKWILALEYDYNQIPEPDLSVYLKVPFQFVLKSLSGKRVGEERNYLNGKDDIHEKDIELQRGVMAEYEKLSFENPDIRQIICTDVHENMRPIEEIHRDIVGLMDSIL